MQILACICACDSKTESVGSRGGSCSEEFVAGELRWRFIGIVCMA